MSRKTEFALWERKHLYKAQRVIHFKLSRAHSWTDEIKRLRKLRCIRFSLSVIFKRDSLSELHFICLKWERHSPHNTKALESKTGLSLPYLEKHRFNPCSSWFNKSHREVWKVEEVFMKKANYWIDHLKYFFCLNVFLLPKKSISWLISFDWTWLLEPVIKYNWGHSWCDERL